MKDCMVVGNADGQFSLFIGFEMLLAPLTVEGLVNLLKAANFDPDVHVIFCSSSIDFPEEYDAPGGFDGREMIEHACAILQGRSPGPVFYPPCVPLPEERAALREEAAREGERTAAAHRDDD